MLTRTPRDLQDTLFENGGRSSTDPTPPPSPANSVSQLLPSAKASNGGGGVMDPRMSQSVTHALPTSNPAGGGAVAGNGHVMRRAASVTAAELTSAGRRGQLLLMPSEDDDASSTCNNNAVCKLTLPVNCAY